MKVKQLTAENVLRLKAVNITPDENGNMIVIGGNNAQGKTSVLQSIEMALAGKNSIPSEPIHRGASKGNIVVDLGDMIIERHFTQKGGNSL